MLDAVRSLVRPLFRAFLKGLLAVLPIAITVFLLVWLATGLETFLGAAVRWMLPDSWYVPGMGLLVGIAAVVAIGVMLQTWLMRTIWRAAERLLDRVPLVRFVYGAVKQIIDYLSGAATEDAQQVVIATIGDPPVQMLGFLTRKDLTDLPDGFPEDEDVVAVYLPMSYQMGGYTVMLPRDRVRPVDMRLEDGLRFALTAGVSAKADGKPKRAQSGAAARSGPSAPKQQDGAEAHEAT